MTVERPVGIIVANTILVVAGISMVLWPMASLRGAGTRESTAALCFMAAGLAGVAGGVGVWTRSYWAIVAMAAWVGATVIGIIMSEPVPLDADVLTPITFLAGPQSAIALYLGYWLRRPAADAEEGRRQQQAPDRTVATGLLLLAGVVAPPVIAFTAVVLMAALPGDARAVPFVGLPILLFAFIVALSRRAASTGPKILFVLIASGSSIISLLVVLIGSMAK